MQSSSYQHSQPGTRTVQRGFLLTRHSHDREHATELVFWLHTAQGPAKLVVENERPLFFIHESQRAHAEATFERLGVPAEIKSLKLQTFDLKPVAAVYMPTIQAHLQAQSVLQVAGIEVFEADIKLHERYLMERFANGGVEFSGHAVKKHGYTEYRSVKLRGCEYQPEFRVVSLDIECSEKGELFSVGLHGRLGDHEIINQVLMIGQPESAETDIIWVNDEPALLRKLITVLNTLDPDIVIGWSVVGFDFRLLCKRAELHNIPLRLGRGGTHARWREGQSNARWGNDSGFLNLPGRVVIDGISALKNATYQFESYSLESVSQALLNRGKKVEQVDNRLGEILHDFKHNKPKLAAYNLEDCRLVSDIFEKTQLLDFLRLRGQLTGLALDRNGGSVAAFSNLYLPRLHRSGYIAPSLPEGGGLASPGGYVMDSKPGLYKNVLVLDFKSLYPSIIRTFKIDPMGLIEGEQAPEDAIEGYLGACFSRERHFLPDIITTLWQQRDQAKLDKDQARSQAIKILMNSFYGVLGSGGCRFYDQRLASSITMRGHDIMKQTAAWIEGEGHLVIYGDTDSIFVLLAPDVHSDEADRIGQQLARDINQRWQTTLQQDYQLPSYLELEFETHYSRFLMPTIRGSEAGSKKRYAGLTSKGQLVFKGLETVRSDWTPLAKQFQQQLYQQVFHDQDPSDFVRQTVHETLDGKHDNLLILSKRLRRPLAEYVKNVPPHVRAARLADEQNKRLGKPLRYQRRGRVQYLLTVNGPEPVEYQSSALDHQAYVDKQLKPVADAILPFIDLSFDSLADAQLGLF